MKIGFNLYYSSKRREKILDAILNKSTGESKVEGKRILKNYSMQLSDQMKRIKQNRQEMAEQGLKPAADELRLFNFMNERAAAFDRNELDPENMTKLIAEL